MITDRTHLLTFILHLPLFNYFISLQILPHKSPIAKNILSYLQDWIGLNLISLEFGQRSHFISSTCSLVKGLVDWFKSLQSAIKSIIRRP